MKKSSLLLAGLVLSVLTFAFGTNHGFNEVFGPLFHPAPNVPPLAGPSQGLDSLHRWNVIAINATGLDHTPVAPGRTAFSENSSDPGVLAGQWRLSTSQCSTRLMRSLAVTPVTPGRRLHMVQCRWTRQSARPRATLWRRCFHHKERLLMPTWQKIWLVSGTRSKRQTGSIWGIERLPPFWRCVSMMVRKFLTRPSASIIFRAINPGIGGRIQ